ncbi:hypothetical protein K2173_005124 [Erythroxylum novogranatense]|uniref:Core domain-containing protein n=1 Tax=Erythroxylum novogranatense TaxID=1862640 RepID=A0AAV8TRF6_9ROSI|nr:hypothetical protein K2173_005124 [Erythroxylum novogranatense]
MAFSATTTTRHRVSLLPLPNHSIESSLLTLKSVSFRFSRPNLPKPVSVRSVSTPAPAAAAPAVTLTENALKHLNKMRNDRNQDLCLRIGVKQGGCSGMSYTMDFEDRSNTRPDDSVIEYNGFVIVCDPKSLLFLFGMQLDYSDALIGGGFSFKNPNATQTCGCGKSFNADM